MKTPWKFLAELTLRRRLANGQENTAEQRTDLKAPRSEVEGTLALSSHISEASGTADRDGAAIPVDAVPVAPNEREGGLDVAQKLERPVDVEEAQAAAPVAAHYSGAELDVSPLKIGASAKPQRKPPIARRQRAKRIPVEVVARNIVVMDEDQGLQPQSPRNAFFDEVEGLDEEIRNLRSDLAQKLYLQNVQLKKMLERFDAS